MKPYVAVCGAGDATPKDAERAEAVGRLLAEAGAILLCGGLAGVMDAAARGAAEAGGVSVGLLPKEERVGASRHLTVALPLGIGEARNALLVRAADAVIAIGGGWGTLSEVAFAMKMGKRVIGLDTWEVASNGKPVDGILQAETPEQAVSMALELGD